MKHLALDLWDDLRQKRLWPVALALLIAVIAIPVVVMKPAEEPPPVESTPEPRQAQATPAVAVLDGGSGGASNLGVFGKKDPFRPPAATLKPSTSAASTGASSVAGASATPPASAGLPASAGSGSGSAPPVSPGSTGGGSTPARPPIAAPRRTAYTYVVDVELGREGGRTRVRRGVPRLTALPSERNPVAFFLGVSASGKRAVFLLNSAFEQRGQGTCRPSRATCSFLHLSTDPAKNGHRLVDGDGVTHVLTLKAIRRVTVREASRASRRPARAGASGKSRRVESPLFADEQR